VTIRDDFAYVGDLVDFMPRGGPRIRANDGAQNAIGERAKQQRLRLSLTQGQVIARLADATDGRWNPTDQEIYRIESKTRSVIDLEVLALAEVLGCSVGWLLTGTDPR